MKSCKTCDWWVNEGEVIGDYDHRFAVEQNKGFCLIRDLFYMTEPDFSCRAYRSDKKYIGGNNGNTQTNNS